jgi:hypothetical protein
VKLKKIVKRHLKKKNEDQTDIKNKNNVVIKE